jgi:hypothetical protein
VPEPFTLPLALLAAALLGATVLGLGSNGDVVNIADSLRAFLPLLLVPVVVVNLLDDERRLVQAAAVAAVLGAVKGLEGVVAWSTGGGRPLEGTTITFYEPAANLLLLVFLIGAAALFLLHGRVHWWVWLAVPPTALAFVFSYRRNFWIAGLIALALTVLLSRVQSGRRALLPVLALLAVGASATLAWRGPPDLEGPVSQRFTSLAPARIVSDPYDRYRLDEQRNVVAEIREHPVLGIGLGVPWQLRHPIPVELDGGRLYVHVVALWWWLKLGLAGLAAYVWLVVGAIVVGLGVARRAGADVVRAGGLALATAFLGMAAAETTGSFTGVSDRYTVLVAMALGWLAAARRLRSTAQPT